LIEIDASAVFRGWLPPRALALVLEWAALHRDELRDTGDEPALEKC
jgi:hypothetical protein